MRSGTDLKSLTLGRGIGQSVYIGRRLDQKLPAETCDIRVMMKGVYETKSGCVGLLEITEGSMSALEIALAENHKNPVIVQDCEIYFTGVKTCMVEEHECSRCGAQQIDTSIKRINGLIRIRAPSSAKISRGNRIGAQVR